MNTQHTPGPWVADAVSRHPNRWVTEIRYRHAEESGTVATVDSRRVEVHEANARLLAASPDLLAALIRLVTATENGAVGTLDPAWTEARAAIARTVSA